MALAEAPSRRDSTPEERPVIQPDRRIHDSVFILAPREDGRATPEAPLPGEEWVSIGDPSGFADTLVQIRELATGDQSDEYGLLRPTTYAQQRTLELLSQSFFIVVAGLASEGQRCSRFPHGAVTTDDQGGLRIEWAEGDRAVHLVVPSEPDGQSYIYHEMGQDYAAEKRVSGTALAQWLARLSG